MKMNEFKPPQKGKGIYIFLNLLLIGFLYYCIAFRGVVTEWTAFACSGFFLFNGFWSLDRRLFSWLHREDTSISAFRHGYLVFLVVGALFLGLGITAVIL